MNVIEWDVIDGGTLGATVECTTCKGRGKIRSRIARKTCVVCDGQGVLHRCYRLGELFIDSDGESVWTKGLRAEPMHSGPNPETTMNDRQCPDCGTPEIEITKLAGTFWIADCTCEEDKTWADLDRRYGSFLSDNGPNPGDD